MKTGHFPEAHGLAYMGCTIGSIMVEGKDYGSMQLTYNPNYKSVLILLLLLLEDSI